MADRAQRAFFCWSSSNFPVEGLADEFVDILRVPRNLQQDLLNMTPKPEYLITLITYLGVSPLVRSHSMFNGRVEH